MRDSSMTDTAQGKPLAGRVALVAGATRGAGRGIACMLGEAGATVYCTGRSSRVGRLPTSSLGADSPFDLSGRPETIEETAEMVTRFGGMGVSVQTDHSHPAQVAALIERITNEVERLDILVNDIWGGDALTEWDKPFWETSLDKGVLLLERAIHTHIITARHALPLMLKSARQRKPGLVVEITDGVSNDYRGAFFYDLAKSSVIRMAYALAEELRPQHIAALALTPGFLRSEAMLAYFGVSEANWQDAAKQDPNFIASETPYFVGRAVAALAADADILSKSGAVYSSWDLSEEYSFSDIDGRQPHWGRHYAELKVDTES